MDMGGKVPAVEVRHEIDYALVAEGDDRCAAVLDRLARQQSSVRGPFQHRHVLRFGYSTVNRLYLLECVSVVCPEALSALATLELRVHLGVADRAVIGE